MLASQRYFTSGWFVSINVVSGFHKRQRSDEAFNLVYDDVVKTAEELKIGQSQLPRYRRLPATLEDGSHPHCSAFPRDYYRQVYFEAFDLLLREFNNRSGPRIQYADCYLND